MVLMIQQNSSDSDVERVASRTKRIYFQLVNLLEPHATSWWFGFTVTILITATGILSSLFTQDIKSSKAMIPMVSWSWSHLAIIPSLFFLLLYLSAIVFPLRQAFVDRQQRRTHRELTDLIRTTPPADILASFSELTVSCYKTVSTIYDTKEENQEVIDYAIRTILRHICEMAFRYDRRPPSVMYAANLMHFVPIEVVRDEEEYYRAILTITPEKDFSNWEGVLRLDRNLSATISSEEPDSDLPELALPVPLLTEQFIDGRARWDALPGAPLSLILDEPDYFLDTDRISDWLKENSAFSLTQQQVVAEYFFKARKFMRSFISIPIHGLNGDQIGIVNVHRSQPNIVLNDTASQLVSLLEPTILMLADLLTYSHRNQLAAQVDEADETSLRESSSVRATAG